MAVHLVPYCQGADGEASLLLGFRRTGPAAGSWTEAASDWDWDGGASAPPQEAASRAASAAFMGVLGTAAQVKAALSADSRLHTPLGYVYLLRVHPGAAETFNAVARHVAGRFVRDRASVGCGDLVGCPDGLLPFSRVQWVPASDLSSRLARAALPRAAKGAPPASRGVVLSERTAALMPHVLPALGRFLAPVE